MFEKTYFIVQGHPFEIRDISKKWILYEKSRCSSTIMTNIIKPIAIFYSEQDASDVCELLKMHNLESGLNQRDS